MEMVIMIDGTIINYSIWGNNCQIKDSFLIKSKKIKYEFLNYLVRKCPEFKARSIKSYYREWKVHNVLYKLHLFRKSTKDTDLNIKEPKILRLGYFIVSLFSIDF